MRYHITYRENNETHMETFLSRPLINIFLKDKKNITIIAIIKGGERIHVKEFRK